MSNEGRHLPIDTADRDGAVTGVVGEDATAWRFVFLAQIASFGRMRRMLGRLGAADLVEQVAGRAREVLAPDTGVVVIDSRTVEIAFEAAARDSADRAAALLVEGFARPFVIDGQPQTLDVVIGAAAGLSASVDELHLLEEAELSVGDARHDRRVHVRDAASCNDAFGRAALARALPTALRDDEFVLHYQPKVHLRRQEVSSIEALIRWDRPGQGLVMPGDFIQLAEEQRMIDELTLWVIRRVIRDQKLLRERGYDPTVFINVSGQLLADSHFVEVASALVRDAGVNIGFEVTETSVIRDPQSAIGNLKLFAEAGITIAIDDYGAGLSSLAYLKQLPASELKIDKLFVTQLASSHRDPLIVRSTIDLAHALGMEVVAEGVESRAALALLTVMGCDMAQGYLISHPIGLDALIGFLDDGRHRQATAPGLFNFRQPAAATRS